MLPLGELLNDEEKDADASNLRWAIPSSRILVVDDGAENRELLSLVLAEQGLWVEEASNGQEALDKAEAESFDLFLMDMQMPVLDGFAATRILRQRGVKAPIVALTANAMKGFEQKILEMGCTAYVTKPIEIDLLLDKVAQLLGGVRLSGNPTPKAQNSGDVVTSSAAPLRPITSRLATNDRLAPIVEKFAMRLDERMGLADLACGRGDCTELASFGHWLAGAAGTMGYDDFNEPSRRLEQLALGKDLESVRVLMSELRSMCRRIESPTATRASLLLNNIVQQETIA